jgi:DNA-binding NtrC family response regulator
MSEKILVVDDEQLILELLESFLKGEGFIIHKSDGVTAALESMKSHDYDLMLIDKNMPGVDGGKEGGLDLLRFVSSRSMSAKVIIMTGNPTDESLVEAMKLGAVDYIQKPFSLDQLRSKIKTILKI